MASITEVRLTIQLSRRPLHSIYHWKRWREMSNSLYHVISMQKSNSKLTIFSRTLAEVSHSHPFYLFLSTASQQAVQSCYLCTLHPVPNTEDKDITYIFPMHKVSKGRHAWNSRRPEAITSICCGLDHLKLCSYTAALWAETVTLHTP